MLLNILLFWRSRWFRSMVVIAKKERIQLGRNKLFWRTTIVFQVLQLGMMGFLDTQTRDLPTVIVDQDHSTFSRELIAKLGSTTIFDVKFVTHQSTDGRNLIRSGQAKVCLIIPPDFHQKRGAGTTADVLMLVDGSDASASAQALAAFKGAAADISVESMRGRSGNRMAGLAVEAHTQILYNPSGRSPQFMLPALLVMMLTSLLMLAIMGIVRERDSGTLERLLMTPLSIAGMMIGKAAPVIVVGMINSVIVLLAMRWIFFVPIAGSIALILFSLFLYVVTIAAMGVYLGSTSDSALDAGARAGYIGIPNMFLSGYIFPLAGVPKILLPISYALPATHAVEVMRACVLRDVRTADVLPHILYLAIVPVFLIWLAQKKFRETLGAS